MTSDITTVEYSTKYNTHLRPITNMQITTAEISPTGSGKNHFYEDSPMTVMIMPTNAMVMQNDGLLGKSLVGKKDRPFRTDRLEVITYDKMYGHLKNNPNFFEDYNIIIDEFHILATSSNVRHEDLLSILLRREVPFKELKLISATMRDEWFDSLDYVSATPIDVIRYIDVNRNPHINFVYGLPELLTTERNLIFMNDKVKMKQMLVHYRALGFECIELYSGMKIPEDLSKYNLILSTSALRQGYSIGDHIDKLIIYNNVNSSGAFNIAQYMARARTNQPDIYVVGAKTHYLEDDVKVASLDVLCKLASGISEYRTLEEAGANKAVYINELEAMVVEGDGDLNLTGLFRWYERYMTRRELKSLEVMMDTIKEIFPSATHTLHTPTPLFKPFKFKRIEVDLEDLFNFSSTPDELKEVILDRITIAGLYDEVEQTILAKISKVKPVSEVFRIDGTTMEFTQQYQVEQMLYPKELARAKQLLKNLEANMYAQYKKKVKNKTRRFIVGNVYVSGSGLTRKLNALAKLLGFGHKNNKDKLNMLKKMFAIEITVDGEIVIVSPYCVKEEYFHKRKHHFKRTAILPL